jgi:hypothetical protein
VALAGDPVSTGDDLLQFGLQAESAVNRCNIDKQLLYGFLVPATPAKVCHWYSIGCRK